MEHNYHYENVKGLIKSAESELITAYRKGYDDAMRDLRKEKNDNHMELTGEIQNQLAKQYARGASAAWNLIRKIINEDGDSFSRTELNDIFGSSYLCTIVRENTGEQALHKVYEYEYLKSKKDLKVGDIVVRFADNKNRYTVFSISKDGKYAAIMGINNPNWEINVPVKNLISTGGHCDIVIR